MCVPYFLMVVMSVMVMMVMTRMTAGLGMTMDIVTVLALGFKLKCSVADTVLTKLLAYVLLDLVMISAGDHVHSGIILLSIHAPYMNMMNVEDAGYLADMLLYLVYLDAVGSFFKKKLYDLLEVLDSVDENKYCNAYRHQGIDKGEVGEFHYDSTDQHNSPA